MEKISNLVTVRPPIPRAKIFGVIAFALSLALAVIFIYLLFIFNTDFSGFLNSSLHSIHNYTYIALAAPIALVAFFIIATGFWIGWTILTIKVVPPMPEIVDKKDHSKIKAFLLCMSTLALGVLLGYGLYIKSFWALAIPATVISVVLLGAIFWVGIAIITTRTTLPDQKKE